MAQNAGAPDTKTFSGPFAVEVSHITQRISKGCITLVELVPRRLVAEDPILMRILHESNAAGRTRTRMILGRCIRCLAFGVMLILHAKIEKVAFSPRPFQAVNCDRRQTEPKGRDDALGTVAIILRYDGDESACGLV